MASRLLTVVAETSLPPVSGSEVGPVRELDRVALLADVVGDDEVNVPAGSVGTVVAVWGQGAAFEVEFTRPVDALATVEAALLKVVERAAA